MSSAPHKMGLDGKRMRLSPPSSSPELPEELIGEEILTRLPIKSVVRFKSVCKSWLSLFYTPQFVKQHSNHQNPNDNDCVVADNSIYIVILSRCQEIFALRKEFYNLIGSANGLVCIRRDKVLSLWNPAIHQSKEFHLPPLGYGCLNRVGLGFDPITNDYKVAICYRGSTSGFFYAVYSSNSDAWIHYQFNHPDYDILFSKFKRSLTPTTMVKDSPYWTCSTTISSQKDKVNLSLAALKFDATSNKFKLLPDFSADFIKDFTFKVLNMRDLLTLMVYPWPTRKLDVYSLDEEKGCGGGGGGWCKMYRFGPFEQFWRLKDLQQGFKYGDEIVFYEYGEIYRFAPKTDRFECIPGTEYVALIDCFTYTPSLVYLPGMASIYSKNQTPPLGRDSASPLRLMDSLRDHLPF